MKKNILYTAFSLIASFGLGYYLGKFFAVDENPEAENSQVKNLQLRNEVLSQQLSNSKAKLKTLEEKILGNEKNRAKQDEVKEGKYIEGLQDIFGKKVSRDDLKLIEGIGPKIEQILHSRAIDTWQKLSEQNSDGLRKILIEEGGEQYHIHNPESWPQQAKLAAESKWPELKSLQDTL